MAQVVAFETDLSVSETLGYVLTCFGIVHCSCLVPLPSISEEYFRGILAAHQPRLIISSYRYIGWYVIQTAAGMRPRPQIWLFTAYDSDTLLANQALFRVDRVFEKPMSVRRIAEEMREALQEMQEQCHVAPGGSS